MKLATVVIAAMVALFAVYFWIGWITLPSKHYSARMASTASYVQLYQGGALMREWRTCCDVHTSVFKAEFCGTELSGTYTVELTGEICE